MAVVVISGIDFDRYTTKAWLADEIDDVERIAS